MVIVSMIDKEFKCNIGFNLSLNITGPAENKKFITYMAIEGVNVLGFISIRYAKNSRYGKIISSNATMVRPAYRKQGVARELWTTMIKDQNPKFINVTTVTNKGYTLVESLRERFPDIKWRHKPNDGLRRLKK